MTYSDLRISRRPPVGYITLARPEVHNAFRPALLCELQRALRELDRDQDVRVIVITGEGPNFTSGGDIRLMATMTRKAARAYARLAHQTCGLIPRLRKPVIAAVNGAALGGGCDLVLWCDLAIAADNARFAETSAVLGIPTTFGGTQRLARVVGAHRANEMFLAGRSLSAKEAEAIGLVTRVVPAAELLDAAQQLGEAVAGRAPYALTQLKRLIARTTSVGLCEGDHAEITAFVNCFERHDQREGMQAFLEHRSPRFTGN